MKRFGILAVLILCFILSACGSSVSANHSSTKAAFKSPVKDWVYFAKDRLGGEILMKCAKTSMVMRMMQKALYQWQTVTRSAGPRNS